MMVYKVIYSPQAYSFLEKLDKKTAVRIVNKINAAREDPFAHSYSLTDMGGLRKIRVGDFRVLILIEEETVIITVVRIKHRRNVYK